MTKILCIGGSTVNQGTFEKINQALHKNGFLNDWAVIIANHQYLQFCNHKKDIEYLKKFILQSHFPQKDAVLVYQQQDYPIIPGNIYILPDFLNCIYENQFISTTIKTVNDVPVIEISNIQEVVQEDLDWIGSIGSIGSLDFPCIDRRMIELSSIRPHKIAGLILAGMGGDGAEGLIEIAKNGGSVAIQDPNECYHPESIGQTASMPKAAIDMATQQNIK
ncbi:chemotaxis protein CheB [Cylindrospermum sp. FACHB-282]|uniref:chemotaxis protein CheB n=1 Tax=Cylindrospermum sp. FACHB-282 TaxID=2692794 RepID=UPI001687030C|nr:chemotaxis protein CheB [Cylindrospermum sp. FACHB-282]MBD2387621.1 hypothetical protein [Cylindrospermum sp. FACHB-282]